MTHLHVSLQVDSVHNLLYLYCEPTTHGTQDILPVTHKIVQHKLDKMYGMFDRMWSTCQTVTDNQVAACDSKEGSLQQNCAIRSRKFDSQLCMPYHLPNVRFDRLRLIVLLL